MGKAIGCLIMFILFVGCASPPEPVSRKDAFRAGKRLLYFPIASNRFSAETQWVQRINTGGDFAISGAFFNGKAYLGGYGSGRVYSYPPLNLEMDQTGEANLGVTAFNGMIYVSSENNNMSGQRTRIFRRNGGWQEIGLEGYAAFFTTTWAGQLVMTSTRDLRSIDVNVSSDGASWGRMATLGDWLWVPAVFRGELYLLGHGGPAEGPGGPKAVRWNGNNFVPVPALCNVPGVTEWQSATEHGGYLYVGSGGWTLARGSSMAAVYRFDGNSAVKVFEDSAYHEVQALLSSRGKLYASFGHGFKSDVGGSKIWRMTGVNSWAESGTFPSPQLYVLMETPQGYLAAGGKQGNLQIFDVASAPK